MTMKRDLGTEGRASQELWTAVDRYIIALLAPSDVGLDSALRASAEAGLPAHAVSPNQGKLLMLLAQIQGARKILEIGTLGGYSAIWMARALPAGGRLITLEANEKHAEVALSNIARAKLDHVVDARVGRALDTLPLLISEAPFDLIFIDADKPNNLEYLRWSIRLSRPGSLIVADNVMREGAVIDGDSGDPNVVGVRRFLEALAAETRVSATAIQTVGCKGYVGFAIVRCL
jgi:predicted O-methyltransferase YrrM